MWMAIGVTFLIFAVLYSGIYMLKRSADKFKIPDNVKAQPYNNDDYDNSDSHEKINHKKEQKS